MEARADLTNFISIGSGEEQYFAHLPEGDALDMNWDEEEAVQAFNIVFSFIALVVVQSLSRRLSNVWMKEASKLDYAIEKRVAKYSLVISRIPGLIEM